MANGVIVAVSQALTATGFVTLRFNFGGVGQSQGVYSGGPEEIEDVRGAISTLLGHLPPGTPVTLVGYSFGAWVALLVAPRAPEVSHVVAIAPPLDFFDWSSLAPVPQPVSVIAAAQDQFCAPAQLARIVHEHAERVRVQATISGADHSFSGLEELVAAACCDSILSSSGT